MTTRLDTPAEGPAAGRPARRILVYGDVNLNLIDGSAIWAAAAVEILALAGCDVTFLLKARVATERLLGPLAAYPNVRIVRPFEEGLVGAGAGDQLERQRAARIMATLDDERRFDAAVLRGWRLIDTVVAEGRFDGRLWSYLTDVPQSVADVTPETTARLTRLAEASRLLLCQTEELRGFLESTVPAAVGRCVLFPPSLPATEARATHEPAAGGPRKLVYSGKFAPMWMTEPMTRIPALAAERGVPVELHMIGDKLHRSPDDPGFEERMLTALRTAPGVVWHGGVSRQAAIALVDGCDIGLGWRDRSLDASLELSTKVLEYGAVGLPVVLNRTPMHEHLLGVDYPLFAGDLDEVIEVVQAATTPEVYALAAQRCRAAAEGFSQARSVARVTALLDSVFPPSPSLAGRARRVRVVVAGHDFKFMTRLLQQLQAIDELDVRIDDWPGRNRHDPKLSQRLADWADVVICEWCGPNAIWYAEHKRPGTRLYVRLHRFELFRPWPAEVDIANVDQVMCVSPYYRQRTLDITGWPPEKVGVIPNWVDVDQMDRPKLPGARFHLGMIGVGDARKRLDLALDVLEVLRRHDDRFMLFAKTKMPWEYPAVWARPGEPEHARANLERVQNAPLLRGAVVFDRFGPDVATWLRRIGFVLSTSDDESFHLAPAEGMASGAVPVIRDWPGSDTIFDPMWIHPGAEAMAAAILGTVDPEPWQAARTAARAQVRATYALDRVVEAWTDRIARDVAETAS